MWTHKIDRNIFVCVERMSNQSSELLANTKGFFVW